MELNLGYFRGGIYKAQQSNMSKVVASTLYDRMVGIKDTREAIQNTPKGIFNAHVFLCACVFALSGVSKGFDEGELRLIVYFILSI